eukprot:CAMPEP_0116145770 /NCGR_PEP_ID=MMETSP0329-20121206/16796_1 /TAXON_ID=697910 /ORGANISM="Pseudo-nitzschia arenysensis, Strain B593" /LENGTH=278 /DNA_ID=CAMNT_0003641449 /DNA_START=111 /DNA_END=947 /DNA_ORIENTATION=+
MSTATLEATSAQLESIKADKHLYNQNKIAEAEALAAEALRMANEAKLAAARLAEVKKTLSMFSSKLEKAEQSVQKDIKIVKEEPAAPVVEEPAIADPPAEEVVTKSLVTEEVVKVVEEKPAAPVEAPKEAVPAAPAVAPVAAPVAVYQPDIVEEFLDGLGVDKMCGVDDETLGFKDKPAPAAAAKPEVFVNPTRIPVQALTAEDMLRPTSEKEEEANEARKAIGEATVQYQRMLVNEDFNDPFGVDHDDLVLCGKIADVCEPPEYEDEDDFEVNDLVQ